MDREVRVLPFPLLPFPADRRAEHVPRLRVLMRFDETPAMRAALWLEQPNCCRCAAPIAAADDGAIVPTLDGPRFAHRTDCFIAAIRQHQDALPISRAVGRLPRHSQPEVR